MFALARFFLLWTIFSTALHAQTDGLFADFVTSEGNFTCELYFDKAPRTVANFAGLASGALPWLDLDTGEIKRAPFYDGITFHRIVPNFVIQGGSPNGSGSDGPGYTFRDEFHPDLRHNSAGILSMANSGISTNGSQFFVTLNATPHLDDVHSVFGKVISGLNIVQLLGTKQSADPKPVIQSVAIRRVGAAANAFDYFVHRFPSLGGGGPKVIRTGLQTTLEYPALPASDYHLFQSSNLVAWTRSFLGFKPLPASPSVEDVSELSAGQAQRFFRLAEVVYPDTFNPVSVINRRLVLTFTANTALHSAGSTLEVVITSQTGGTTKKGQSQGTITQYFWTPAAYSSDLRFASTALSNHFLRLDFLSASNGKFGGTYGNQSSTTIAGTFTIENAVVPATSVSVAGASSPTTAQRFQQRSPAREPYSQRRRKR